MRSSSSLSVMSVSSERICVGILSFGVMYTFTCTSLSSLDRMSRVASDTV